MHGTTRLCIHLLLVSLWVGGCGGSGVSLKKVPPTINSVKSGKGYLKQVAVVLSQSPASAVGQGAGALYFKSLVKAIAEEDSSFRLVKPGDNGFPGFLVESTRRSVGDPDVNALSRGGRQAGFQGLVVAAVRDIRVSAIRTGLLFLRKTRYQLHFDVTADLYDPYSGAKVVSGVMESKVRISEIDYEDYLSGTVSSFEDLDEEIAEAAEDLGESIGEALSELPWKAAVVGSDGDRIVIPAGSGVGLKEGDRFSVFEGRRQLAGNEGALFIAPGYQVGTIHVTAVAEQSAEAQASTPDTIQDGDIVVPVR